MGTEGAGAGRREFKKLAGRVAQLEKNADAANADLDELEKAQGAVEKRTRRHGAALKKFGDELRTQGQVQEALAEDVVGMKAEMAAMTERANDRDATVDSRIEALLNVTAMLTTRRVGGTQGAGVPGPSQAGPSRLRRQRRAVPEDEDEELPPPTPTTRAPSLMPTGENEEGEEDEEEV